jgi:hypothetical protein
LLAFAAPAPNLWLALALVLGGASQIGHWVIELTEAARGRKLMRARQAVAVVLFVAVPVLALVGLAAWAL